MLIRFFRGYTVWMWAMFQRIGGPFSGSKCAGSVNFWVYTGSYFEKNTEEKIGGRIPSVFLFPPNPPSTATLQTSRTNAQKVKQHYSWSALGWWPLRNVSCRWCLVQFVALETPVCSLAHLLLSIVPTSPEGASTPNIPTFFKQKSIYTQKLTYTIHFDSDDEGHIAH
jgi:hypothetical protein